MPESSPKEREVGQGGSLCPSLRREELIGPVGRLLGTEQLEILCWQVVPLRTAVKRTTNAYYVEGEAEQDGLRRHWSLVLKELPADDPASLREAEMYRSDLLPPEAHDGLCAPRYLGLTSGERARLWLSDVGDDTYGTWPIWRYGVAARHLGMWNGTHPAERIASHSFLSQGWIREWIEASGTAMEMLKDQRSCPVVASVYSKEVLDRLFSVWSQRHILFDALERLPQVLCHLDAHRHNFVARDASGRSAQTYLVDWQFAGIGGLGMDGAPLLGSALTEATVPANMMERLEATVFGGYMDGLRQAGWSGSTSLPRLGFAATAGLRYTLGTVRFLLPALSDRTCAAELEAAMGRPLSTIAEAIGHALPFFLAMADEAIGTARHLAIG